MDKGFKRWVAGIMIAHLKAQETTVLKDERVQRTLEEERIRTHCRRCGWRTTLWILQGLSLAAFIIGVFVAVVVLLSSLVVIVGTVAFMNCAWQPPVDQCLRIELVNMTSNEPIWSNEVIWENMVYYGVWQQSVHISLGVLFGKDQWKKDWETIQSRVCPLVAKSGLNLLEMLAGIHKI